MAITTGNGSVGFGTITPEERRNDPWYSSAMCHEENMMNSFLPTYDASLHADMVSPQHELINMLNELQAMDGNLSGDMSTFNSAEEYIGNLSDDACKAYIAMIDMAEGSDLNLSGAVVANDIIAYATGADPVPESVLAQQDNVFYAAMLAGYDSPELRLDGGNGKPITSDNWDKKQDDVYSQLNSMYDATAHSGLYNSDGALNTMRTEEYILDYLVESGWPEENMRQVVDGMEADEMTAYIALMDAAGKEPQVVTPAEVGGIIQFMSLNYGEKNSNTNMPQSRIDDLSTILFVDGLRDEGNGITVLDYIDFSEETPTVEEQEVEEPVETTETEVDSATSEAELESETVVEEPDYSDTAYTVADMMLEDPAAFSSMISEAGGVSADGITIDGTEVSVSDLKDALQIYVDENNIDFDVQEALNAASQGIGSASDADTVQLNELTALLDGTESINGVSFADIGVNVEVDAAELDFSDEIPEGAEGIYEMMMSDPESFVANLQTATYSGGGIAEFAGEEVEVASLEGAVQAYLDANGIDMDISSAASQMQSGLSGGQDQFDMYIMEVMSGNASIDGQDLTEVLAESFSAQAEVEVEEEIESDTSVSEVDSDEATPSGDGGVSTPEVNASEYDVNCTRAAYDILIHNAGGTGASREAWCEAQGLNYEDVQGMVNQIYNEAYSTDSTYMSMRDAFELSVAGGDYEITDTTTTEINSGTPTPGVGETHVALQGVGYIDYMVSAGIDDGSQHNGSYCINNEAEASSAMAYVNAVESYGGIQPFMSDLSDAYSSGSAEQFIADLETTSPELAGYAGYLTNIVDNNRDLSMESVCDEVINDSHPNMESACAQIESTEQSAEIDY